MYLDTKCSGRRESGPEVAVHAMTLTHTKLLYLCTSIAELAATIYVHAQFPKNVHTEHRARSRSDKLGVEGMSRRLPHRQSLPVTQRIATYLLQLEAIQLEVGPSPTSESPCGPAHCDNLNRVGDSDTLGYSVER